MNFLARVIGFPLGYIMFACYFMVPRYGLALILFSVITKVIFWPLSVSSQKNSIRLLKLQPQLDEIKQRYAGEKDRISEEQYELFKREKYNPLKSSIPLLIQLFLILGMVNVIYNPLTHLLHIDGTAIEQILEITRSLLNIENMGTTGQLLAVDAIHNPLYSGDFAAVPASIIEQVKGLSLSFLGLNLGATPSFSAPSGLLFVPFVSGLSSLALCLVQNRLSPAQRQQRGFAKWGMTIFLVAFSTYFPMVVPSGVGIYWICSNIFGIAVAVLLNNFYNPMKLAGIQGLPPKQKINAEERRTQKQQAKTSKKRERIDYKRFFSTGNPKKLVFYSVSNGQFKYFQTVIEYLLTNTSLDIHYVTNDANDAIFSYGHPQIKPYYIGPQKSISLMMKMDADMVVMTVPDLQKYHIKRSIVRDNIEYVYMFHTVASMHMTLRLGAVDHYDTIFCVGPHQVQEIRQTEAIYGLPKKKLVKCGYSAIDLLMKSYEKMPPKLDSKPQILLAPSWQVDNIMDTCLDDILNRLVRSEYKVIVRPHPEYIKRFPQKMEAILERWQKKCDEGLVFELDFSSADSIYQSDILITDWSNTAFEFSYCTKQPSIFINTPMKVMNPEYEKLGIEPLDIGLRTQIGVALEPDDFEPIVATVRDFLSNKNSYREKISHTVEKFLYHPGRSGEAGGKYIEAQLRQDDGPNART